MGTGSSLTRRASRSAPNHRMGSPLIALDGSPQTDRLEIAARWRWRSSFRDRGGRPSAKRLLAEETPREAHTLRRRGTAVGRRAAGSAVLGARGVAGEGRLERVAAPDAALGGEGARAGVGHARPHDRLGAAAIDAADVADAALVTRAAVAAGAAVVAVRAAAPLLGAAPHPVAPGDARPRAALGILRALLAHAGATAGGDAAIDAVGGRPTDA
jgi:hypothetical protein